MSNLAQGVAALVRGGGPVRREGRVVRRKIRLERLTALRRLAWPLVGLAVLLSISLVGVAAVGGSEETWFAAGVFGSSWLWVAAWGVVSVSGTANRATGIGAQAWTETELRKLRSAGWRAVHGVPVPGRGDIDHVVVGPGGGVAIETKWSTDWDGGRYATRQLEQAAAQARAGRKKARAMLLSTPRQDIEVVPLVVVWGRCSKPLAPVVDDVDVVHGTDLRAWLQGRDVTGVDPEAVPLAVEKLERLADTWDAHEAGREAESTGHSLLVDVGPVAIFQQVVAGLCAGLAAFVVAGLLIKPLQAVVSDGAAVMVVMALMFATGLVLRRMPRTRTAGTGVLAMATGLVVVITVTIAAVVLA